MTPLQSLAVAGVGTLVGLDVASVPQAMYSRPLVAGLLGGAAVGAPLPGLAIGALLELFALDTLPVGAARYPDWGPGSVAVGALAGAQGASASGLLALVLVASLAAWAGGWLAHRVRRANSAQVAACHAALEAGDARALRAIQRGGLVRDALRSLALTAFALAIGHYVLGGIRQRSAPVALAQVALVATSVGVALYAAWRLAGRGRAGWFASGMGVGLLGSILWLL